MNGAIEGLLIIIASAGSILILILIIYLLQDTYKKYKKYKKYKQKMYINEKIPFMEINVDGSN